MNDTRILEHFNKHMGERCFVVATGPSLNSTDLNLIHNEVCFGVNNLYQSLDRLHLKCRYYALSDPFEWRKIGNKLVAMKDTTLFSTQGDGRGYLKLTTLPGQMWKGNFSKDLIDGIYPGGSVVTSIVLQATYYMGFREVYLLGCDCNYDKDETKRYFDGKVMSSEEKDWVRRFDPKNAQFTNDWSRVFASYEVCKEIYESSGRKIVNSTVGGRLEVFERKSLQDVIAGR